MLLHSYQLFYLLSSLGSGLRAVERTVDLTDNHAGNALMVCYFVYHKLHFELRDHILDESRIEEGMLEDCGILYPHFNLFSATLTGTLAIGFSCCRREFTLKTKYILQLKQKQSIDKYDKLVSCVDCFVFIIFKFI